MIRTKRVYAAVDPGDGVRVLVDRLWPRGVRKEAAAVDVWFRDIAPSPALRKWFGHDAARWSEFSRRYRVELGTSERREATEALRAIARENAVVTLLFGAREERHNHACLLQQILDSDA